MLFVIFTLVTLLRSIDAYNMHSNNYFMCSAGGFKEECEIHRENAEESLTTTFFLSIVSGILISFINLSHLMYVVNISKLMKSLHECVVTCCK